MKLRLSKTEIEDCIRNKLPSVSKVNWEDSEKDFELEIELDMDSIVSNPKPLKLPKDVEKNIDRQVARETQSTPQSRNVMTRGRRAFVPTI